MFVKKRLKNKLSVRFLLDVRKISKAGAYIPSSMNHGKVVYKKQKRSRGARGVKNLTFFRKGKKGKETVRDDFWLVKSPIFLKKDQISLQLVLVA